MVPLIIIGVAILIGLAAFVLAKYIPSLNKTEEKKKTRQEIAKENAAKFIVNPSEDIATRHELEVQRKKELKKIKKKAMTEEEETKLIVESHLTDNEDEVDDEIQK